MQHTKGSLEKGLQEADVLRKDVTIWSAASGHSFTHLHTPASPLAEQGSNLEGNWDTAIIIIALTHLQMKTPYNYINTITLSL